MTKPETLDGWQNGVVSCSKCGGKPRLWEVFGGRRLVAFLKCDCGATGSRVRVKKYDYMPIDAAYRGWPFKGVVE